MSPMWKNDSSTRFPKIARLASALSMNIMMARVLSALDKKNPRPMAGLGSGAESVAIFGLFPALLLGEISALSVDGTHRWV
jgi:hypothetical protein